MATVTDKTTSDEIRVNYVCQGCSTEFCLDHFSEHRMNVAQDFDRLQNHHNQLRQDINDLKIDPTKHLLVRMINQWENESIKKIQQTARQCRREWIHYSSRFLYQMEKKLNNLAENIKEVHRENEMDFDHLRDKCKKLQDEIHQPKNISIQQRSTSFIKKISVLLPVGKDTRWKQVPSAITHTDRLHRPHGISIDEQNQVIYIADQGNNRIIEWEWRTNASRIVAGGNRVNGPTDVIIDRRSNSLIIADYRNRRVMRWSREKCEHGQIIISDIDCVGLALDGDDSLYVSNYTKNEVRRWKKGERNGTVIAGGNGLGDRLNQLNYPTYLFVDDDHTLYISDSDNHRVMKWMKDAKEGIVVAGGNCQGNEMTQLSNPGGVTVDQFGHIYVADCWNHRVMRWCKGANEGVIIVDSKDLGYPVGLSFDHKGNLFLADWRNNRITLLERTLH